MAGDPYYTMPKLVVIGSNDSYWATDATPLYWPGLPEPKLLYVVPNGGHNVVFGDKVLTTIAAFAPAVALKLCFPRVQSFVRYREGVELTVHADRTAVGARLWSATALSPDLDRARWRAQELLGNGQHFQLHLEKGANYLGFFAGLVFDGDGLLRPHADQAGGALGGGGDGT